MNNQQFQAQRPQIPTADGSIGLHVLRTLMQRRSLLAALEELHTHLGNVFQITLPRFRPVVLVGADSNRSILGVDRDKLNWRNETDPVTRLLRHGVLVEDGASHDRLRRLMEPALHYNSLESYVSAMWQRTDQVSAGWSDGMVYDMLDEMRRITLLILFDTLFDVNLTDELDRLWTPIHRALDFISPGIWVVWPNIPRPGYKQPLATLDEYLYEIIRRRRERPTDTAHDDLLGRLIATPELSDDRIRDQLLTMLIAGHDTSTALLAWTLYLLGRHPQVLAQARVEVDNVLGTKPPTMDRLRDLHVLSNVIREVLRLYPPIHVGNRMATSDLRVQGYDISAGSRIMYSIYLTHRYEQYWDAPTDFRPERFASGQRRSRPPFSYVPFGGGPRNCIGAGFAHVEAQVVLARLLQSFDLFLTFDQVMPYMGATLEPRPGVKMRVYRRDAYNV